MQDFDDIPDRPTPPTRSAVSPHPDSIEWLGRSGRGAHDTYEILYVLWALTDQNLWSTYRSLGMDVRLPRMSAYRRVRTLEAMGLVTVVQRGGPGLVGETSPSMIRLVGTRPTDLHGLAIPAHLLPQALGHNPTDPTSLLEPTKGEEEVELLGRVLSRVIEGPFPATEDRWAPTAYGALARSVVNRWKQDGCQPFTVAEFAAKLGVSKSTFQERLYCWRAKGLCGRQSDGLWQFTIDPNVPQEIWERTTKAVEDDAVPRTSRMSLMALFRKVKIDYEERTRDRMHKYFVERKCHREITKDSWAAMKEQEEKAARRLRPGNILLAERLAAMLGPVATTRSAVTTTRSGLFSRHARVLSEGAW